MFFCGPVVLGLMVLVSFTLEPIASLAADSRETEVRKALQSFWHCWETNDAGCMDKLLVWCVTNSNDYHFGYVLTIEDNPDACCAPHQSDP
jgi:hypothetical protein